MTTYYVGPGGNDANAGTSWALRKLTLNGAEDIPVASGDTVYVGPGTYRELLTVDVSGASAITYIGDYTGANTDGAGGIVRITGAANETTTGTRANCITANAKNYRTFRGFLMDGGSAAQVNCNAAGTNWIIDQCVIVQQASAAGITFSGAAQSANAVTNCAIVGSPSGASAAGVLFTHTSGVDNSGQSVKSCLIIGHTRLLDSLRVGGITVANCTLLYPLSRGVNVSTLTAGQTVTVNNSIAIGGPSAALYANTLGEITEDYNTVIASTARTNVTAGANSVAYPPGFDMRPYFEAFNSGNLVVPLLSLASYSGLVEYSAGTGAPTTDIRGTSVQGSLREWGAEEYDSSLGIEAGGTGIVNPVRGRL